MRIALGAMFLAAGTAAAAAPRAEPVDFPILVPLTGALALEGQSQRNGALLAFEEATNGATVAPLVLDTGSSPQTALHAFARAEVGRAPFAAIGPIDGNSMLALLPHARRAALPLLTPSGTAAVTEPGNPYVFRFFPSDVVVKAAQARFTVEELGRRKIALLYQNTAYGQSGKAQLERWLERLGASVVHSNSITVTARELLPVVAQVRESGADAVVLQLHAGSTALFIQQAARAGLGLPIVAGSAMHQPSTAALLEPAELKGVCAETAAAPAAEDAPALRDFTARYRLRHGADPDAFALASYDSVRIALALRREGATSGEAIAQRLARGRHAGVATSYEADANGNMVHDAIIVCFEGERRTPRVVKRYHRPHDRP